MRRVKLHIAGPIGSENFKKYHDDVRALLWAVISVRQNLYGKRSTKQRCVAALLQTIDDLTPDLFTEVT